MSSAHRIHHTAFDAREHLPGVVRPCAEEGRDLRAPAHLSVVAGDGGRGPAEEGFRIRPGRRTA